MSSPSFATDIWTGAGISDNWSEGENWESGTPPVSSESTLIDIPLEPQPPLIDIPITLERLSFSGTFSTGFTRFISGAQITFSSINSTIDNSSSKGVSIGNDILIDTDSLTVTGNSSLLLEGVISGDGQLIFHSPFHSSVELKGSNTYTGKTIVRERISLGTRGLRSIPGDMDVLGGDVNAGDQSIDTSSNITIASGQYVPGSVVFFGSNTIGSLEVIDSNTAISVTSAAVLNIDQLSQLNITGALYVDGTLNLNPATTLEATGSLSGTGLINGNFTIDCPLDLSFHTSKTLAMNGDITMKESTSFNLRRDDYIQGPSALMNISGNSFTVNEGAKIQISSTVNEFIGTGEFIIIDWSQTSRSTVNLDNFILSNTDPYYSHSLRIENNRLILSVTSLETGADPESFDFDNTDLVMWFKGLNTAVDYKIEKSIDLEEWHWLETIESGYGPNFEFIDSEAGATGFYRLNPILE